ncbi:MAG: TIGR00282 family metallophosphoesterase [Kiritimatiellae bacterium]|nr:TIGR00282 family metallophosphoesterase [Kiritimatiellia bacterium]MCO5069327.1 TIGR00282 family metallophosphoesterase [Kiritimatiellia bacterium]
MPLRILHIGDIVGSPGRRIFARLIPRLRAEWKLDAVIANAENAAAGRGLTPTLAEELFSAGADLLTLGDHTWDQKEILPYLIREPRVIRPANFAPDCPGKGWGKIDLPNGVRLHVLSLIGRVFMPPADCPFRTADAALQQIRSPLVFTEIHAEATSEKIAIGRHLEGRVSSVVGTHTHVQTSDEAILPKGTAYITDLGMTGPKDSVLGRDVGSVLKKFITGLPTKFEVAENDIAMEGALITVDPTTGRASAIQRIRERE